MEKKQAAQNESVNGCISAALKLLNTKTMVVMGYSHRLQNIEVPSSHAQFKATCLKELEALSERISKSIVNLQAAFINNKPLKFMDQKVDLLSVAGT
eukprot:5292214-Alexandrium_andersonii.AAC.1